MFPAVMFLFTCFRKTTLKLTVAEIGLRTLLTMLAVRTIVAVISLFCLPLERSRKVYRSGKILIEDICPPVAPASSGGPLTQKGQVGLGFRRGPGPTLGPRFLGPRGIT
jgi:hypothetical protein